MRGDAFSYHKPGDAGKAVRDDQRAQIAQFIVEEVALLMEGEEVLIVTRSELDAIIRRALAQWGVG